MKLNGLSPIPAQQPNAQASSAEDYTKKTTQRQQHIEFHVNQLHYKHFYFQGSESMSDVYDIVKGAQNVEAGKEVHISAPLGVLSISQQEHNQRLSQGQNSIYAHNVTALTQQVDSFSISW